jgi:hypothetical protein
VECKKCAYSRFADDSCERNIKIEVRFTGSTCMWDRGSMKPAGKYTFLYGKGNENRELGTGSSFCI